MPWIQLGALSLSGTFSLRYLRRAASAATKLGVVSCGWARADCRSRTDCSSTATRSEKLERIGGVPFFGRFKAHSRCHWCGICEPGRGMTVENAHRKSVAAGDGIAFETHTPTADPLPAPTNLVCAAGEHDRKPQVRAGRIPIMCRSNRPDTYQRLPLSTHELTCDQQPVHTFGPTVTQLGQLRARSGRPHAPALVGFILAIASLSLGSAEYRCASHRMSRKRHNRHGKGEP